jgi:Cu/Ag efflux protein CusF
MTRIAVLVLASVFAVVGFAAAAEMEGKIQSVDTGSKEVSLDSGGKLVLDDATKIMVEGKEGNLEDLKAGATVKAGYEEKDGKNVATTIEVSQ